MAGYTTTDTKSSTNFSSGPYLSALAYFYAYRASGTASKVTVSCAFYLGFGTSADSTSQQGDGYDFTVSLSGNGLSSSATLVQKYSDTWKWDGKFATFNSSYSTVKGGTPHRSTTLSGDITNWTDGKSKSFTVTVYENGSSRGSFTGTLACPTYYTNASVSMTTKSQTVDPGGNITFQWSGTSGTNNAISKYTLYYNGTAYDCSTNTSKTLPVPPANTAYNVYVSAKAAYNTSNSSTITITTRDYGIPTATISTESQTLKPDTVLAINWSGTAGTANPISKYQLYYNDQKIYEGTGTSYEIEAPPVDSSYIAYVNAVGTYGSKIGKSSDITISTAPYMWLMVSGVWKSVQSVYIYDDEWKEVDASDPLDVGVDNIWKGV